jgi:isocitrate dehydrogenase (NADP) (EC 1.1.1.42)
MNYKFIKVPTEGDKIFSKNSEIDVPDHPIIPFIEGDGIGPDIWHATSRIIEAAVKKSYGAKKKIYWMEVFAGEKAKKNLQRMASRRNH